MDMNGTNVSVPPTIQTRKEYYRSYYQRRKETNNNSQDNSYDFVYNGLPKEHCRLKEQPPCVSCEAKKIQYEFPTFCCMNGKTTLQPLDIPPELYNLFTLQCQLGKMFRKNIRAYNTNFSFASMGVTLDKRYNAKGSGVYTFRVQGGIYHRIDQLVSRDEEPRYLQLYFYDAESEFEYRLKWPNLDKEIITILSCVLAPNLYVQTFRSLGNLGPLDKYRVELTVSVKVDQRLYNRPTTSKDPLSYPLFFPNGEAGWHSRIPKEGLDIKELVDDGDDVPEGEEADKLANPDHYDKVVCAKILDPNKQPELHQLVLKHMIHDPCGHLNTRCPCMEGDPKKCRWNCPRQFQETTQQGDDSYPLYRRRDNGIEVNVRNSVLDNRWVVPYNPKLLMMFNCHINVEVCSSIKSVKYVFKYVYKGHDKKVVNVDKDGEQVVNEIKRFQDVCYVSPPEAMWQIYGFPLSNIHPSVMSLQVHLPNKQFVTFKEDDVLTDILKKERNKRSMLTAFFELNQTDTQARNHLYKDIPKFYTWNKSTRKWNR
ncbi:hypothetical protein Tco_0195214 [Tanacetum coccineum]